MPEDCQHDYIVFKRTWQSVDYARYQVLDHSYEAAVCKKCFRVLNPWKGEVPENE